MAVDERARRHLHERLDETLGPQAADVLMEELAMLGREQLATRHDVELLRRDMDTGFERLRADLHERLNDQHRYLDQRFDAINDRFDAMNDRFDAMNGRFEAGMRQTLFWMLGVILTVAALAFGAAQLT